MSEGVYAALNRINPNYDWLYINHVIHNRSDYFISSFITENQNPVDFCDIGDADNDNSPNFPNISLINEGRKFISNQRELSIDINGVDWRISFLQNIETHPVDIILMDNFMDIASRLVRDKLTGKCFFIHSASYSQDVFLNRFEYTDFLTPSDSISNYLLIINWLRKLQPNAKIYFLPFPSSVYGHEDRESVIRAAEFRRELTSNPLSVPALDMLSVKSEHMLALDDWCHYAPSYYQTIASQIII